LVQPKGELGNGWVSHQDFGKMPFYDHRTPAAPGPKIGSHHARSGDAENAKQQLEFNSTTKQFALFTYDGVPATPTVGLAFDF